MKSISSPECWKVLSPFPRCWRAFILTFAPFLVHSDYFFGLFFGNSAFGTTAPRCPAWGPRSRQTPSNTPRHLMTWHVERVERWRNLGAAAELRPFGKKVTTCSMISFLFEVWGASFQFWQLFLRFDCMSDIHIDKEGVALAEGGEWDCISISMSSFNLKVSQTVYFCHYSFCWTAS